MKRKPKSPAWTRKEGQNPSGGLNARGRSSYNSKTGGNLKAPVSGTPKTPEQLRRQGSFLVRMGSSDGPLRDEKGEKTRLKKSLEAWNHFGDKASAVSKGRRLLARYEKLKINKKKTRSA